MLTEYRLCAATTGRTQSASGLDGQALLAGSPWSQLNASSPVSASELFPKTDVNGRAAQFFSAAGVIGSNGSYVPAQWKTYLIALAILTFCTLVNLFGNRLLGRWNDGARKSF